ncbi:MAG: response regulator [Thermodesulfobacteriota bacterium]|nr:response regulator [Thermodesulfobacteriota bacterium]
MMNINSQDALREFLYNINVQDSIKARLVLDCFDRIKKKEQRRILFELNKCEDNVAIPLLIFLAVRHEFYARQYPTLQETIFAKALNSPDIIIKYLRSDSAEQLYYIKLAGDLRLQGVISSLEKPLAVCTDLNMPEITGIELIQKVRQQYGSKELPIIMVTTQSEIQEIKTAGNAGADIVLNKPFNTENLGNALKDLGLM